MCQVHRDAGFPREAREVDIITALLNYRLSNKSNISLPWDWMNIKHFFNINKYETYEAAKTVIITLKGNAISLVFEWINMKYMEQGLKKKNELNNNENTVISQSSHKKY